MRRREFLRILVTAPIVTVLASLVKPATAEEENHGVSFEIESVCGTPVDLAKDWEGDFVYTAAHGDTASSDTVVWMASYDGNELIQYHGNTNCRCAIVEDTA